MNRSGIGSASSNKCLTSSNRCLTSEFVTFLRSQEDLSNQVIHFKKAKIKAEESLRREREELQKEKMRLAKESEVGPM